MKFPKVTVVLVSAALLFVLWEQTRERPQPVSASRFTNLAANPVEAGLAMDWVVRQLPALCEDATGQGSGSDVHAVCVSEGESRTSACRRAIYDRFPSVVASEEVFRDMSITAMSCLVPQSGLVE
jgi:hypothetical protein